MSVPTSLAWQDAIGAEFRRQGYLAATIDIVPPGVLQVTTITSNFDSPWQSASIVMDGVEESDNKMATYESGYWKTDGSQYLPSIDPAKNAGTTWWSNKTVDTESPVLNIRYSETMSIPGLTCEWDNGYPTKIEIIGYNSSGMPMESQLFTFNSEWSVVMCTMDDITGFDLKILEWSIPGRRARMRKLIFGVIVQIEPSLGMSASETTSIDLMGSQLPRTSYELNIRNIVSSINSNVYLIPRVEEPNPMQNIMSIVDPEFVAEYKVATYEIGYWKSDGTHILLSKSDSLNPQLGWASEDAEFDDERPIEVIVEISSIVDIHTLDITWDTVTNSWPTKWKLIMYDANDEVMYNQEFSNTSPNTSLELSVIPCSKFIIQVMRWSVANWRVRMEHIVVDHGTDYGNVYDTNEFFDPMLKRGLSKYLASRQRMVWYWGFVVDEIGTVEWLVPQPRYLDTWNIPTDAVEVKFTCTSRLDLMTQTYIYGQWNNTDVSLYDLAVHLMNHSSVIKEYTTEQPYSFPDVLKTIKTKAPLPTAQENILLQYIAGAGGCILTIDPTTQNILMLESPFSTSRVVTRSHMTEDPAISIDGELKDVYVHIYSYAADEATSKLYEGIVHVNGRQTVTIYYSSDTIAGNAAATITGAQTVNSISYYTGGVVIDLTANDTDVSVIVEGNKLVSSSILTQFYHDSSVKHGNVVTIDNPLVTNRECASIVANNAIEYYQNRHIMSFSYTGFPELTASDEIEIQSKYVNSNSIITKSQLSFNGGWNGSLEVKLYGVD